jgi:hypothetical protein
MTIKKTAFYLLIAFTVVFVVQAPNEAARIVKSTGENAGEWFSTASAAFTRFVSSLI